MKRVVAWMIPRGNVFAKRRAPERNPVRQTDAALIPARDRDAAMMNNRGERLLRNFGNSRCHPQDNRPNRATLPIAHDAQQSLGSDFDTARHENPDVPPAIGRGMVSASGFGGSQS